MIKRRLHLLIHWVMPADLSLGFMLKYISNFVYYIGKVWIIIVKRGHIIEDTKSNFASGKNFASDM